MAPVRVVVRTLIAEDCVPIRRLSVIKTDNRIGGLPWHEKPEIINITTI